MYVQTRQEIVRLTFYDMHYASYRGDRNVINVNIRRDMYPALFYLILGEEYLYQNSNITIVYSAYLVLFSNLILSVIFYV